MSLMDQGINLMLFGMGTVFTFLLVLIIATKAMSALIKAIEGPPVVTAPTVIHSGSVSPEIVAVISAAVAQHRAQKR